MYREVKIAKEDEGQRQRTRAKANKGGRGPTREDEGRTTANEGGRGPTREDEGQRGRMSIMYGEVKIAK